MKRDAWYAAIAATGLLSIAALYALWAAPQLADPSVRVDKAKLTASLPSPPKFTVDQDVIAKAQTILRERDPFVARSNDDDTVARGLELPKLAPPVRFSDPGERATVVAAPEATIPLSTNLIPQSESPPAPLPPSATQQTQGSLTLRGVFPSPNGGRALVALPGGSVVSVTVGGVVGGWRVLDIRQGAIRLGRGQRAILLAMPR